MRYLSAEFTNRLANNSTLTAKATVRFADGTSRELAGEDFCSLSVEQASSSSGSFDIGAAVVGQLTCALNNYDDRFSECDFEGAAMTVWVGATLPSGNEEWVKLGVYYVDRPDSYAGQISLTALDCLSLFEKGYNPSALTRWPRTLQQIADTGCTICGLINDTAEIPNGSYSVASEPDLDDCTWLDVMGYIAQVTGTFVRATADGHVEFAWYDTSAFESEDWNDGGSFDDASPYATGDAADGGNFTDYSSGDSVDGGEFSTVRCLGVINHFSSLTVFTDDVVITGVSVTAQNQVIKNSDGSESNGEDGEKALYGSEGYVLSLSDNPLILYGQAATVAAQVGERVVGMRFRPFSCDAVTDPSIEPGDAVLVYDRKGNEYWSYVTSTNLAVNSSESIECSAQSASRNSATSASAATRAIVKARNELKREQTARELAQKDLQNKMETSSGLYSTRVEQSDGSIIYYLHDKSDLQSSGIVWKMTADAMAVSTAGPDGPYVTGLTADGTALLKRIYAVGIDADYISDGTIEDGTGRNYWDLKTGEIQISNYATLAQATGEGDELIANNIDGTGTGGWCSYTGTDARTDGRSQWNTVDGYQVVQLYGTADSASKYRGQYYASDDCPLTAAASGTAAYPRAVDMSCEMRVATATADSGGYFRMTLQYKDASGNWGWLAGPTVPISAVMSWTKCSARAVLPAGCAISGVWCFVHVTTAGATVNCLLRQAHAKISPVGTGGANLMAGTAGFSALTGGAWADGAIRTTGAAPTLSHAHDSTCPVPESDCVTITATATSEGGICQDGQEFQAGDVLTFSLWAKASREGSLVRVQPAWSPTSGATQPVELSGSFRVGTAWTRLMWTTTVMQSTTHTIGYVYFKAQAVGDKLYVCGLKVERGGVASAWSTAPTDLTNYMRFTSEGLEVGKKVNGSYSGSHTVTKSDGFYIHDASHNDLAHYTSTEASLAGGKAVFKENEVKLANGKAYLSAGTTGGGAGAILRAANSSYPAVAIRSSANNSDNEINVWGTTGATMRGGGTQLSVENNSTGGTVSTVGGRKLSTNADWFQLGVNGNAGYKTYYLHTSDFYREISMASGLIIVVRGGLVCINVNTSIALASSWATQQLGTIPSDLGGRLRPKYDVYAPAVCTSQTGAGATFLHVNTSGGIYLERQGGTALTTTAKYVANLVYPTQLNKTA